VGANSNHGKRRTNADKRKAVLTLLEDEQWAKWSDREIARRCLVSGEFAHKLRRSLPTVGSDTQTTPVIDPEPTPAPKPQERTFRTKHGTVAKMKTDGIGKSKPVKPCGKTDSDKSEKGEEKCKRSNWKHGLNVLVREMEPLKRNISLALKVIPTEHWPEVKERIVNEISATFNSSGC
jgi:hypothetical protein